MKAKNHNDVHDKVIEIVLSLVSVLRSSLT